MTPREIAARIGPNAPVSPQQRKAPGAPSKTDGTTFAEELRRAKERASPGDDVNLSAHAAERIEQREISLNAAERASLGQAMHTLSEKGAQDAVVLRSDAAFVVNVPNRTVVTAMPQGELKNRVFTQIDSAMLL